MLHEIVRKLTGRYLFKILPHGVDLFVDLSRHGLGSNVQTIVDIGANTGKFATRFRQTFEGAEIYCIEPIEETYRELERNTADLDGVHCFQLALSGKAGRVEMVKDSNSVRSRIALGGGSENALVINAMTLDGFCDAQMIKRIDILKIDTEGHDLDVLHGSREMLSKRAIDIIIVEAGVNPRNKYHVNICEFIEFFDEFDMIPFGFYEQMHEWPTNEPYLRRSDAAFILAPSAHRTALK